MPSSVHGEITVVVADDDHRVGSAVAELLEQEPDFRVVGHAATGDDAMTVARRHRPELVLADVRMPGGGPELVRRLVALDRPPVVAGHSAQGDIATWTSMLAAGATGYLLKGAVAGALPELLRSCMLGHLVVAVPGAPQVVGRLVTREPAARWM